MILDLNLPDLGGLEILARLLREDPGARVLVLSMHAEPLYASQALKAGAKGYVSKAAARLRSPRRCAPSRGARAMWKPT